MAAEKSGKKKQKQLSPRQLKLIKERAKGKSYAQAAIAAGYPAKNARQSGYQAMQQIRGRVPDLMDKHGLTEDTLIDKYLRPLLEAEETKFFNEGKKRINVAALGIRLGALRELFLLHGSYAPRDPKEAAQFGVKVVVMDLPRPPRLPINVTPTTGRPPADGNGRD